MSPRSAQSWMYDNIDSTNWLIWGGPLPASPWLATAEDVVGERESVEEITYGRNVQISNVGLCGKSDLDDASLIGG